MKLSTSLRWRKITAKSLKIGINGLETKAKEENCITMDVNGIIPLF